MKNKDFIHLHIHSEYSIGYSICKINEIYEKVKENNMSSFAITDYNNLLGLTDILVHPMVNEIQPIIGCEIEIDSQYKLVLLVMNEKGYKNLVNLVIKNVYNNDKIISKINFKDIELNSSGLIALSSGIKGEIAKLVIDQNLKKAEERIMYYQKLYGKNQFFLEISSVETKLQKNLNQQLLLLSKKTGVPLVATNQIDYLNQEDALLHSRFLKHFFQKQYHLQGKEYDNNQHYFKSYHEMEESFKDISLEALSNTIWIADQCKYLPLKEIGYCTDFSSDIPLSNIVNEKYKEYKIDLTKYKEETLIEIKLLNQYKYYPILEEILKEAKKNKFFFLLNFSTIILKENNERIISFINISLGELGYKYILKFVQENYFSQICNVLKASVLKKESFRFKKFLKHNSSENLLDQTKKLYGLNIGFRESINLCQHRFKFSGIRRFIFSAFSSLNISNKFFQTNFQLIFHPV